MAASHQTLVSRQFNRQVGHYLRSSAMADRRVIEAIVTAAPIQPGQRVLDVGCGAGFLMQAYRDTSAEVFGVDLSEAMLREAGKTLAPAVDQDQLLAADSAHLPFAPHIFDLVTCKLVLHYLLEPQRAIEDMARCRRRSGLVALIDRVASEDPELCPAQNRLEKLRTPKKVPCMRRPN